MRCAERRRHSVFVGPPPACVFGNSDENPSSWENRHWRDPHTHSSQQDSFGQDVIYYLNEVERGTG